MLTIAHIYPELLGTYGDGGNVHVLLNRLTWRGVDARVEVVRHGEPLPRGTSLLVIGGGEDDAQLRAAPELRSLLRPAVEDGAVVLAVCAGLQLLGHTLETAEGITIEGAGLLDVTTVSGRRRAVGEVTATATAADLPRLTGFANHNGATTLGPLAQPLGRVRHGPANHPLNRSEGAVQGRVFGSYLHGPVLARNPALADHLLRLATGRQLAPLPDLEVRRLRLERLSSRWRPR